MRKIVFIITFITVGTFSFGNDGSYRLEMSSGNVFPLQNENIRMLEETVVFRDDQIQTTFKFQNDDKENNQNVVIGFPVIGKIETLGVYMSKHEVAAEELSYEEKIDRIESYYCFYTMINGKQYERKLQPLNQENLPDYDFVYLVEYNFKPNEIIEVENSYFIKPSSFLTGTMAYKKELEYVLVTGALWKGMIEKAIIKFYLDLPKYRVREVDNFYNFKVFEQKYEGRFREFEMNINIPPASIIVEDEQYVISWEFEKFEPSENIRVSWGVGNYAEEMNLSAPNIAAILDNYINREKENIEYYDDQIEYFSNKNNFIEYMDLIYWYLSKLYKKSYIEFLDTEDLYMLSRFYINGIYAMKGHKFNNPRWQCYFNNLSWYNSKDVEDSLSMKEQEKIDKMIDIRAYYKDR